MRSPAIQRILVLTLLSLCVGGAQGAVLELHPTVTCTGQELLLTDLVARGELGELGTRVIARSPIPGRSRELVRHRLARQLADWGWRGSLTGPDRIVLSTPGVELDTQKLQEAVAAKLDRQLDAIGLRRSGELEGWPSSLCLSTRRVRWQLDLPDGQPARAGKARLAIEDEQGFATSLQLRYRCTRPLRVAVAGRDTAHREVLTDWRVEERDGLQLDGKALGAQELEGAVATRAIAAGEVLTWSNTKPAPLVRAGREVEVRLQRGAVTVTLRGVARADGALGELVTVRDAEKRTLRRYRVAGPGIVVPAYIETGDES